MMKKYCIKCGSPNAYVNGLPPKFCSQCGQELTLVSVPAPSSKKVEDDVDKLVEARVNELLKKRLNARQVNNDSDEELEDSEPFYGEIPKPSPRDCQVYVPKFLTIADLKDRSDPITRDNQQPPQDYSKE